MCKISVVLPVYNGEKYVRQSVESVLNQSYSDFELILVNDCSTDGTKEILQEYANSDKRVKLIDNSDNLKLPESLNRGFEQAYGEYWTWTSHDNIYEANAFEKMADVLEGDRHIGMVYSDYCLIDADGAAVEKKVLDSPKMLLTGNVVGACFLYRSSVAKKVGLYDKNLFLAEDYDYWLRIYEAAKLYHLNECLYRYRAHDESLTATRVDAIKKQTAKVWLKHIKYISDHIDRRASRFIVYDRVYTAVDDNEKKNVQKKLSQYDKMYPLHLWAKRLFH